MVVAGRSRRPPIPVGKEAIAIALAEWLGAIGGLALTIGVWALFVFGRGGAPAGSDSPQLRRVRVRSGFQPAEIHIAADIPTKLVFRREETAPCSERVVFPDLGISATLPTFRDVTVELPPSEPGTHPFTCGMDMLYGRLLVELPPHADRPHARTSRRWRHERRRTPGRAQTAQPSTEYPGRRLAMSDSGLPLIMVGFLIQWPTIPTLLMLPVLAITYRRLAIREEREVRDQLAGAWEEYAIQTPPVLPARRGRRHRDQADAPGALRTSVSLTRGNVRRPMAEG